MSPAEAGATTVTVICVAVIAAYRYLCWLLDRHIRQRRQERLDLAAWQARAAQAARDANAFRAARDLAECIAIWNRTPHDIPHQTRRTEEDQ
ncbi:hypothetical protein ACFXD5_19525 [Streptomyces sp. NPDC059385]|uniref:hypothetical protein n=1 Tax=Streptomyces sp. NPDC059385 TaxID=3346817 RepID=UPI003691CA5D